MLCEVHPDIPGPLFALTGTRTVPWDVPFSNTLGAGCARSGLTSISLTPGKAFAGRPCRAGASRRKCVTSARGDIENTQPPFPQAFSNCDELIPTTANRVGCGVSTGAPSAAVVRDAQSASDAATACASSCSADTLVLRSDASSCVPAA